MVVSDIDAGHITVDRRGGGGHMGLFLGSHF